MNLQSTVPHVTVQVFKNTLVDRLRIGLQSTRN